MKSRIMRTVIDGSEDAVAIKETGETETGQKRVTTHRGRERDRDMTRETTLRVTQQETQIAIQKEKN